MTVLAADRETARKEGGLKSYPCGVDIIYKGGMVGIGADGYAVAMPVAASAVGLRFAGVAYEKIDNSAGSAGDEKVRVYTEGLFLFTATSITQVMVGEMMYMVDDNIFDDVPGTYSIEVGILVDYVSATSGWIDIGPAVEVQRNPKKTRDNDFITKTDSYTVLVTDSGAVFAIATDAKVFTLPSTAKGLTYSFVNTGADAAVLLSISPAAVDKIMGGQAGVDNKDLLNTKATAKKGDRATIVGDGGDGWYVTLLVGTWAAEA